MEKRRVTLFVKSIKRVKIEKRSFTRPLLEPPRVTGYTDLQSSAHTHEVHDEISESRTVFDLPEDQKKAAQMVSEVARQLGFEVEIVDVSKLNLFPKIFKGEIRRLRVFPTIVTDSGKMLYGSFSKKEFEEFLSREKQGN